MAPLDGVSVTSTCSFAAGVCWPLPLSLVSVTVNVCGTPTSFVASGAIEICALPHVFWAGLEFRPWPFVVRVTWRPASVTVPEAETTDVPGDARA